jgi:hypothetical protein
LNNKYDTVGTTVTGKVAVVSQWYAPAVALGAMDMMSTKAIINSTIEEIKRLAQTSLFFLPTICLSDL